MKERMIRPALVVLMTCVAVALLGGSARAQRLDVAAGASGMAAPSASDAEGDHSPQSLTGGVYPSLSVDAVLYKNFGFQGELSWKATRGEWEGFQPYRPFFYDFNGMYAPKLSNKVYLQLLAGIGAESTRYYTPNQICGEITCQNFVSVSHFMGHFGGGLQLYAYKSWFVRPEAHLYLVHNNEEFSSNHALRYGVSIGYTFGKH